MFSFKSRIEYDARRIVCEIHTARDSVARESVAASIAMLIDLDQVLLSRGSCKDSYKLIQAHGGNGALYEHGSFLMSKDDASKSYDIISSCNLELWYPSKDAITLAYASGKIKSHEIVLNKSMGDINIVASIEGDGFFVIGDTKKNRLDIGGSCHQYSDDYLRYESFGITKLKMYDFWNFSK